jgi:hypothetical protein
MNSFICTVELETNIVLVLWHILHPWFRSMKNQWNANKFYSVLMYEWGLLCSLVIPMVNLTCTTHSLMSCHSIEEHRASVNVFHLTRFDASAFTSPHVLLWCPISSYTVLFHVVSGRPLLRVPCGCQSSACFSMVSSHFLSLWPIHLHFRLLIRVSTGSSPASSSSSSVLIFSCQWIFRIFLRHLLMKVWSFLLITVVPKV